MKLKEVQAKLVELGLKQVDLTIYPFNVLKLKGVENVTANLITSLGEMIII